MSRLLVNIRGRNGAGKSTIPISMMSDPRLEIIQKPYKGKTYKVATVFPSFGWVVLGSYLNKTGGLDTFPNNELMFKTLKWILKNYSDYNILMEGIIASTIYSTYRDLFNEIREKCPDTKIVLLFFMPPLETSIQRVYERNGGKPVKEDAIKAKYGMVSRNFEKFKRDGFCVKKIDTSKTPKDRMLTNFLKLCNKYQEEQDG